MRDEWEDGNDADRQGADFAKPLDFASSPPLPPSSDRIPGESDTRDEALKHTHALEMSMLPERLNHVGKHKSRKGKHRIH